MDDTIPTEIIVSVCAGEIETVRNWLSCVHERARAVSSAGWTLLHHACCTGHGDGTIEMVEMLLEAGCDPRARTESQQTPLHLACDSSIQLGFTLVQAAPELLENALDDRGRTPLQNAEECYGLDDEDVKDLVVLARGGVPLVRLNLERSSAVPAKCGCGNFATQGRDDALCNSCRKKGP